MALEPANSIKSLLIRAWRERWSDIHWGIHIKTVLPRYISGDIYQLSDVLLQQALIGSLPNKLILSYLHHSLASQIVSFGGVIESISKYDGWHKPYCIQALLDIMKSIMKNVYCKGKADDCLILSSSIVGGVKWLFSVISTAREKLTDVQTSSEHLKNINLADSVLREIIESDYLLCLFHLGCLDDSGNWNTILANIDKLKSEIEVAPSGVLGDKQNLLKTISQYENVKKMVQVQSEVKYDLTKSSVCHMVFSLIMLEVMKHTTRNSDEITRQLILLQKFKGLSLCDLYLELIRTCFIGMSFPEHKKYQELKWVGFTFIKLPKILHSIHEINYGDTEHSSELLYAMQKIASMTSLLEVVDYRLRCNCLEYFLKELIPKVSQSTQASHPPSHVLLTESDAQSILADRMLESNVLKTLKNSEVQGSPLSTPDLILRAQPTVIGILKTLANKSIESVMTVLSLLISGKSRELLLIAATSSGNLHIYAQKFVKLNEQNKDSASGEMSKMASNRALVFDISFLLLCHIAQVYGVKVVVSENGNTFVERWIQNNIPELGKVKSTIRSSEDETAKIEHFLQQIKNNDPDSTYVNSNFGEKCRFSAIAIKELMNSVHHGQMNKQVVYELLDKFCLHMCSLPICVTAWLCSYIQQVEGEEIVLAKEFLKYMEDKMVAGENQGSLLETFKDRSNLMLEIIGQMSETVLHLAKEDPNVNLSVNPNVNPVVNPVPLVDLLDEVWREINKSHGLLTHKALASTKSLLRLSGVKWFVTNYVKCALDNVFDNELQRAIDVTFGIFHFDIISCTFSYIIHTLPTYICGAASADLLCEPRTSALARLTAMLLVESWVSLQSRSSQSTEIDKQSGSNTEESRRVSQKRSFSQREVEELQKEFLSSNRIPFDFDVAEMDQETSFFLSAVHNLFLLMTRVSKTAVLSPVTHLIVFTLKELAVLPHTSTLLTLLPPTLLSNLLPLLSHSLTFSYQELLALSSPDPFANSIQPLALDLLVHSRRNSKEIFMSTAKMLCAKRNFKLLFE